MTRQTIFLLLFLVARVHPFAKGSDDKPQAIPSAWQEDARMQGLSEAEIFILQRNDILLSNLEYRQIYSAYADPDVSVFITSDSLLNAYHVLLEESVVQFESGQVSRLSDMLRMILTDLETLRFSIKDQPKLNAAALRRARLVIGIAVRLLDSGFVFGDAELDDILIAESARIESAEAVLLPEWLGVPSPSLLAIHYSRFRPRSFYTRSVRLERYFRAVSWLQAVPFRIEQDEELLAMLMLGHALRFRPSESAEVTFGGSNEAWEADQRVEDTLHHFYEVVGDPDLPDILVAADTASWLTPSNDDEPEISDDIAEKSRDEFSWEDEGKRQVKVLRPQDLQQCRAELREKLHKDGKGPQINDQDRLPPDDPRQVDDYQFRVISASRTPDAALFQRTTDARRFNRQFPSGLEVAVALGSPVARTFLNEPEKERLLQEIDSCKEMFESQNLYGVWLNTLKALLDEPEHDAPEFMRSEAWQSKSCNAVLASWTQLRHTSALHAKLNGGFGGGRIPPPGFVEPDPEFFSRMATLAVHTKRTLCSAADLRPLSPDYRQLLPILKSKKGLAEGVVDAAAMKLKLKEQSEIDDILRSLSYKANRLVSQQWESEIPFDVQWSRIIDQDLSSVKIDSMSKLAESSVDFQALIDQFEELKLDRHQLVAELIEDLRLLADEHPQKSLPSGDRWNQVRDRYLPRILNSLRSLADGIVNHESMTALIESRWNFQISNSHDAVTQLIHSLTLSKADSQVSYSLLWDRVVEQLIQEIQHDVLEKNPELTAIVDPGIPDLGEIWDDLISTSRRLEIISHKQLRGADLNESERWFVLQYGETLSELMLRSNLPPKDDVPWATAVYTNHLLQKTLHATTSRPRALYVLYPWGGTKVLSRGAVLPYREVISGELLTDEQWRQQLDTQTAPPLPEWLQPILSPAPQDP